MTSKDRSAPEKTNDRQTVTSARKSMSMGSKLVDQSKDKPAPRHQVATEDSARVSGKTDREKAPATTSDPSTSGLKPLAGTAPEEITGTSNPELLLHLVAQVWNAGTQVVKSDKYGKDISKGAILAALKGIAPQNEMEGMLAVQMVATHSAAMECLRLAAISNLSPELRDQNLKHAAKLSSIYIQQMEALDKRRGKGQQKITVEHVSVHAGGQAIVGNVEAPDRATASPPIAPLALPDRSDEAMPLIEEREKEKVPRKLRSR